MDSGPSQSCTCSQELEKKVSVAVLESVVHGHQTHGFGAYGEEHCG